MREKDPIRFVDGCMVDRTREHCEDAEILVRLDCGHEERFWEAGLSDREYVRRAKKMKRLDPRGDY